jgi:hypothetical protein
MLGMTVSHNVLNLIIVLKIVFPPENSEKPCSSQGTSGLGNLLIIDYFIVFVKGIFFKRPYLGLRKVNICKKPRQKKRGISLPHWQADTPAVEALNASGSIRRARKIQ